MTPCVCVCVCVYLCVHSLLMLLSIAVRHRSWPRCLAWG